jgi:hypothetical protein
LSTAQEKLIAVKLIHTLIWAMFVSLITMVVYSGVTGHITPYSWIAVAAIIGEGAVLLVFKGRCPLTVVARKYSDSPKDNFDIYLPNWLAKYNKVIFTTLFGIGLLLMLFRTVT